jgi:hypothetical protein
MAGRSYPAARDRSTGATFVFPAFAPDRYPFPRETRVMRALIPIIAACLTTARAPLTEAQAPARSPAPCRTTALTTVPQLYTQDGGTAESGGAALVERFYVAMTCDGDHRAGDYQIWWKERLTSPATAARLVAIIDQQTETCAADCYVIGPEFDFFIEVNNWRMRPGCYGVKAIFGDAVDEYWQCTRTVLYTLAPDAHANRE